jgi:hypothetical protein
MCRSVSLLLITLMFALMPSVQAADSPNLLILGADADKDSVPRNSRVFRRVLARLNDQMNNYSFDVYDETLITLDNFEQGRSRRSDAEIIDIARSIQRPPIDIAVIFSIYVSAKDHAYTTKVKARIEGRLLNVKTGKNLGAFDVDSGKYWNAPGDCPRQCLLSLVGDNTHVLANDLGAVLAEKLSWMFDARQQPGSIERAGENAMVTDYDLLFDGFSPQEYAQMEEYLVIFSGYHSHRPVEVRHTRTEIWYKSAITTAKLNRNIHKMLAEVDLRGMVAFNGQTFTVKKITFRGKNQSPINQGEW